MKEESVLNILMYLFQNHMKQDCQLDLIDTELFEHLESVGFGRPVIIQALRWLSNLTEENIEYLEAPQAGSQRIFSDDECERINLDCQGFLLSLEQQGILTARTREIVIQQALELESEGIDLGLIKWVTLMVLFNQPDDKSALACMELLVLDDTLGGIH